jgi:hypothetical protein
MGKHERTSFHRTCRGSGDGMQAKGIRRNTGSPSGDRGVDQLAARERKAGLTGMAERLVVLMKPTPQSQIHDFRRLTGDGSGGWRRILCFRRPDTRVE